MKTGAIVPYESSEFLKKYRINLPESITAEVQALLSDYVKKLYGTGSERLQKIFLANILNLRSSNDSLYMLII